jgi:Domain of unknown function (DUF6306)
MSRKQDDGPSPELASPACSMGEAEDVYMGYADGNEILDFLNTLVEAERAGARVTHESAQAIGDSPVADLLRAIQRDEARWCGMLMEHVRARGAVPSKRVGDFYDRAMAIGDVGERIDFLNRGQGWVVRKLREMIPRVRDNALHGDLVNMLESHVANIALAGDVAKNALRDRG